MKGKGVVFVVLILVVIVFGYSMRLNLPPNDIAGYVHIDESNTRAWYKRVLATGIATVVLSNPVAGWQYYDLIIFKAAHSERLELLALAFPFQKWRIYNLADK